jgi:hypothetical protein
MRKIKILITAQNYNASEYLQQFTDQHGATPQKIESSATPL